jgi:hypothetical protein
VAYRWDDRALVEAGHLVREPGTHAAVMPEKNHSCRNEGPGSSLHLYFPRLRSVRVFDLVKRETLFVSDECGAWVSTDPEQARKVVSWPTRIL